MFLFFLLRPRIWIFILMFALFQLQGGTSSPASVDGSVSSVVVDDYSE